MEEKAITEAPVKKEVEKAVTPIKDKVEKITPKKEIPTAKEVGIEKVVTTSKVETPTKEEVLKEMPKTTTPAPVPKEEIKVKPKAFSHAAWNNLAQKHISSTGKVNYKGFKADIAAFDAYLKSLADNRVQSSWSRNEKMAYWINAYNAFTIKLIVDNYPVKSIMDLEGGKPWIKNG